MRSPTPRQIEVLAFVQEYRVRHQRPPTLRDIGVRFGISRNAAKGHLEALEAKGLLTREAGRHRALAVRCH